jgi:nitrate reductase NapAB chaperone NapD
MGTKQGVKQLRIYASAYSSSSEAWIPLSSPHPLPSPPLAFLSEDSSQGPPLAIEVHDEPSEGSLVVILDSEDEDKDWDAPDTSQHEEIARNLFNDLNRDLLGPLGDGKVIIVNDSNEEKHEDDHANADAAPYSLRVYPTPSASATDCDGRPLV